jgi:hypothetical protein
LLAFGRRVIPRQTEKAARFINGLDKVGAAGAFADDVEKIAMFACGGVSLMCNST